ncbi:MAG: hypothetical protein SNJ50_18795, partial [Cyanobacteriota bacterium]
PKNHDLRAYAPAMNFLDFGLFLMGAACEKWFNCVSPIDVCMTPHVDARGITGKSWDFPNWDSQLC